MRNRDVDFYGETPSKDTHPGTADEAGLYRKTGRPEFKLCLVGHVLGGHRDGPVMIQT